METSLIRYQTDHQGVNLKVTGLLKVFPFLDHPGDIQRCRLVCKEWNVQVHRYLDFYTSQLQTKALSYTKQFPSDISNQEKFWMIQLMVKIKEAHDMLTLTIIADPPYMEGVRGQKIHPIGSHLKNNARTLFSDPQSLNQGNTAVPPKDLKFYTTIPDESIQLLQKQLKKEVMGRSLTSKQDLLHLETILPKAYLNIGKWLYMVLDCAKIKSKLSEKARRVVSDMVCEIPIHVQRSLGSVYRMRLLLDRNEAEQYFEKRVEEYRIRIEETRKRIKEKNEELIALKKTVKSLAEALQPLEKKHKIEMWKIPKKKSSKTIFVVFFNSF